VKKNKEGYVAQCKSCELVQELPLVPIQKTVTNNLQRNEGGQLKAI